MIKKRRMKTMRVFTVALAALVFCIAGHSTVASAAEPTEQLIERYTGMLNQLRAELTAKVPKVDLEKAKTPGSPEAQQLKTFLASDKLDAKLAKYVVLLDATPKGLAEFAQQGKAQAALLKRLLADDELMKQMLVADGAKGGKYGPAIKIYTDIQKASKKAKDGVLQRLALGTSLEHAVPIKLGKHGPADRPNVDPVKRYLQFEKAYLGGELDPAFEHLTAWDLRFIVNGYESDETLVWAREMLRNYRPDHIYTANEGWRYVALVTSAVRYGGGDCKYDRPELDFFQNILMNGGVCGRRAFFGRFILRAFGTPTTGRGQPGHAALVHRTSKGWVPCLGADWGKGGWAGPIGFNYAVRGRASDLDFLAVTQGRATGKPYMQVVRARSIGDVLGEKRAWGFKSGVSGIWNGIALRTQQEIIKASKTVTLGALGEDLGEANEPTIAEKVMASPVTPEDKKIIYGDNGVISIPAAAYSKPSGNTREVFAMKSFAGGLQIFLPRFSPVGLTILRGGAWKEDANLCKSGSRLLSGGHGRYNNWGFRAAMTHSGGKAPREVKFDLGDGVTIEFVYIKPGTFVMGGESTKDGRFNCVEVPKHEVTITKGFYLGKYEVTQAQYQAIIGWSPSQATKTLDCAVDTIAEGDARMFCKRVSEKIGRDVRLPNEAEWEHACRAGSNTKWFFGDDPSKLGDYAWYKDNDGGKSHPVGQKKPNPWGLYDICGNVWERVSDRYARNYYAESPKEDPTGFKQADKSCLEYNITVPEAGDYTLAARVVTVNYDQQICVSANGGKSETTMTMPFTCGTWMDSKPVTLNLKKGENTLQLLRRNAPQFGMAIKSFTLKPVRWMNIIPTPKSIKMKTGSVRLSELNSRQVSGLPSETLDLLQREFPGEWSSKDTGGFSVRFLKEGPLVATEPVEVPAGPDAYVLRVTDGGIAIDAKSPAAVWYGLQTLRQMSADDGTIPVCEISDHAAIPRRGIHWDLKGYQPKFSVLLDEFRRLAEYKVNLVLLELEDKYEYRSAPKVGVAGAYTFEQMRKLSRHAAALGITIVPKLQCLGHVDYLLKHERYRHLREAEHPYQYCPRSEQVFALWQAMALELMKCFAEHDEFFHIGADETNNLGECAECAKYSKADTYVFHVDRCLDVIAGQGRTPVMWDDILRDLHGVLGAEEAKRVQSLSDKAILNYWSYGYGGTGNAFPLVHTYRERGARVWGASGFSGCDNWAGSVPPLAIRAQNIDAWTKTAVENHLEAVVTTGWTRIASGTPPTEPLETSWFSVLYAAESMWSGKPRDLDEFVDTLALRIYGTRLSRPLRQAVLNISKHPFSTKDIEVAAEDTSLLALLQCAAAAESFSHRLNNLVAGRRMFHGQVGSVMADYLITGQRNGLKKFLEDLEDLETRCRAAFSEYYETSTVEEFILTRFGYCREYAEQFQRDLDRTKLQ